MKRSLPEAERGLNGGGKEERRKKMKLK